VDKKIAGRFLVTSGPATASGSPDMGMVDCSLVKKGPAFNCLFVWADETDKPQSLRPKQWLMGLDSDAFGMRGVVVLGVASHFEVHGPLKEGVVFLERECSKASDCPLAHWRISR
jgi:hypothetical protein